MTPTIRTEYIRPACTVPPLPAAEPPAWADLYLPFRYFPDGHTHAVAYDAALDMLEAYDHAMADALIEARAMLHELCR